MGLEVEGATPAPAAPLLAPAQMLRQYCTRTSQHQTRYRLHSLVPLFDRSPAEEHCEHCCHLVPAARMLRPGAPDRPQQCHRMHALAVRHQLHL